MPGEGQLDTGKCIRHQHRLPREVGEITVPGGIQNSGDRTLGDVVCWHGGISWGWTWGSERPSPAFLVLPSYHALGTMRAQ